jgi:hypothetical protein
VTKYLREINFKEERFISVHCFRGFSPMEPFDSIVLGAMVRQNIVAGSMGWTKAAHLTEGRMEVGRRKEGGPGSWDMI